MMVTTLAPLPHSETGWLKGVALPYFAELAPGVDPPPDDEFDAWFENAEHSILRIETDGIGTGFALIWRSKRGLQELSEFCVLPTARGQGIGTRAAALCFALHPGPWRLGVARALPGTARFWDRLLPTLDGIQGLARGAALTPYQSHSYTFVMQEPT
jgi:aldehyde dehydrogenase (NAD+)